MLEIKRRRCFAVYLGSPLKCDELTLAQFNKLVQDYEKICLDILYAGEFFTVYSCGFARNVLLIQRFYR